MWAAVLFLASARFVAAAPFSLDELSDASQPPIDITIPLPAPDYPTEEEIGVLQVVGGQDSDLTGERTFSDPGAFTYIDFQTINLGPDFVCGILIENGDVVKFEQSNVVKAENTSPRGLPGVASTAAICVVDGGLLHYLFGTVETDGNQGTNIFVSGEGSEAFLNGVVFVNNGAPPIYGAVAHQGGIIYGSNIQYSTTMPRTCGFIGDSGTIDISQSVAHGQSDFSSIFCTLGSDGVVRAEAVTADSDTGFVAFLSGTRTASFITSSLTAGGPAVIIGTDINMIQPSCGRLQLDVVDSTLSQTTPGNAALIINNIDADIRMRNTLLNIPANGNVLSVVCGTAFSPVGTNTGACRPADVFFSVSQSQVNGDILIGTGHILFSLENFSYWRGAINTAGNAVFPPNVDVVLDDSSQWELVNDTYVQSIITADPTLSNIRGAFTLFYNARNLRNEYLGGFEIPLPGGGRAVPYNLPFIPLDYFSGSICTRPVFPSSMDAPVAALTASDHPGLASTDDAPANTSDGQEDQSPESSPVDAFAADSASYESEASDPSTEMLEDKSTINGDIEGGDLFPVVDIFPDAPTSSKKDRRQSSESLLQESSQDFSADSFPEPPTSQIFLYSFPWPFPVDNRFELSVVSAKSETVTNQSAETTFTFYYSFGGTEKSSQWAFDKDGVLTGNTTKPQSPPTPTQQPGLTDQNSSSQIVLTQDGSLLAAEINRELMPIPGGNNSIQEFPVPPYQDKKLCGCTTLNNQLYCLCPGEVEQNGFGEEETRV